MKSEEKLNGRTKKKISVITVILWIFLIATMITMVSVNIKSTNALENDSEKINMPEAPNTENTVMGYIHISCDNESHTFNNLDATDEYLCTTEYSFHILPLYPEEEVNYISFEDLFIVGDIVEEEGVYKCDCKINYDYLIDIFNKNNGNNHYKVNLQYYDEFIECGNHGGIGPINWNMKLVYEYDKWCPYFDDYRVFDSIIWLSEYNRLYSDEVRLTYDGNGGENVPEVDIKSALDYNGTEFTISSVEPTKLGCRFLGWSDEKNSGKVDYMPGENITLVEDKTIYAVWEEVSPTKKYGSYRVIHEYYTKDEDGKITLEDKITSDVVTNIEVGKKVGIAENDTVDIEVNKELVHIVNGEEYNYEYLENSGNIVIEENVEKEITIKYVRNIGDEKEEINDIEKDDINNSIGNVDTSDINIFVYVLVFIIAILMIAVIIVYIIKKNKSNK